MTPVTHLTTLGAFTLIAPVAHAAETSVPCDTAALIQAIDAANAAAGPDILSLAPNCVYPLPSVADATWTAGQLRFGRRRPRLCQQPAGGSAHFLG